VYVNGEALFETLSTSFLVPAVYGDVVEVKTQKACEGVFFFLKTKCHNYPG